MIFPFRLVLSLEDEAGPEAVTLLNSRLPHDAASLPRPRASRTTPGSAVGGGTPTDSIAPLTCAVHGSRWRASSSARYGCVPLTADPLGAGIASQALPDAPA